MPMSRRRWNLARLCVLVAALFVLSVDAQNSTSNATISPANVTLSNCEKCRDKNDCSLAYQNQPGRFCNNWLNKANERQACCCAANAFCFKSTGANANYECKCTNNRAESTEAIKKGKKPTKKPEEKKSSSKKFFAIAGMVIGVLLLGGCVYCIMSRRDEQPVAQAYPTPAAPVAYAAAPPTNAVGHAPTSGYQGGGGGSGGGGMSTGGAAAAGAVAGFAGGMLVQSALSTNHGTRDEVVHHHYVHVRDDGDGNGGGGGGGDGGFAGDC